MDRHNIQMHAADGGRAGQNIAAVAADLGVVSSERRNISAMIRAMCSGRPRWSVTGRATQSA